MLMLCDISHKFVYIQEFAELLVPANTHPGNTLKTDVMRK